MHLFRQMQPPLVQPNPPFVAFRVDALRQAAIMARMLRDARVSEVLFFPANAFRGFWLCLLGALVYTARGFSHACSACTDARDSVR